MAESFFKAFLGMFKGVRLKVVIADDSPFQATTFKKTLDDLGHWTFVAEHARKILPLVLETMPDLILLDMNMEGMSGIDVLERIKMDSRIAAIPVVVCTGELAKVTETHAMRLGAHAYLQKPVPAQKLKDILGEIEKAKAGKKT